jgi:V-type H+-transporting ATPase proteolipid subunit
MAVLKPELIFKSIVPIIMAGILGIYGLIVCIIIFQKLNKDGYTEAEGYKHLAAGLCCGFSSLVSYLS